MGKILLIEPYRILQQAISLTLFPEHEVHVDEGVSEPRAESLQDYDLVIVDGAGLREKNQLTPGIVKAVQASKTPTLWLEDEESSQAPRREKLVVVRRPLEREALRSGLEELLSGKVPSKGRARAAGVEVAKDEAVKGGAREKETPAQRQASFEFIELVDVVEDPPSPKPPRKSSRKSE